MVAVAQEVAHAAEAFPVRAGAEGVRFVAEAVGCFGNDLDLALDGRFCSQVCFVGCKVDFFEEHLDVLDTFQNVSKMIAGIPKRQGLPPPVLDPG